MKRLIFAISISALMLCFLAACGGGTSQGSSLPDPSLPASSSESPAESSSGIVSESSEESSDINIPGRQPVSSLPTVSASEINIREAGFDGSAKTFAVDRELREEYFDMLSKKHSMVMPTLNFENIESMDDTQLIYYAVYLTAPIHDRTSNEFGGMCVYNLIDLQYTLQKYLGVQLRKPPSMETYIFTPLDNTLRSYSRNPMFFYYYRLNKLSVDEQGLYSAEFTSYRNVFVSDDDYDSKLPAAREALCSGKVSKEYKPFITVSVTFRKMLDEKGDPFLRICSRSSKSAD